HPLEPFARPAVTPPRAGGPPAGAGAEDGSPGRPRGLTTHIGPVRSPAFIAVLSAREPYGIERERAGPADEWRAGAGGGTECAGPQIDRRADRRAARLHPALPARRAAAHVGPRRAPLPPRRVDPRVLLV